MNPDEHDGLTTAYERWAGGAVLLLVAAYVAVILAGLALAR